MQQQHSSKSIIVSNRREFVFFSQFFYQNSLPFSFFFFPKPQTRVIQNHPDLFFPSFIHSFGVLSRYIYYTKSSSFCSKRFPRDDDDDDADEQQRRCGGGRSKSELDDDAFATNHRLSLGVDTKKRDWNDEQIMILMMMIAKTPTTLMAKKRTAARFREETRC